MSQLTYQSLIRGISRLLESARRNAARAVNTVLTVTYWEVGRRIIEFEQKGKARAAYGEKLLERLSCDLTRQLGRGFSERNLEQMRLFYLKWPISQTVSAKSKNPAKSSNLIRQTDKGGYFMSDKKSHETHVVVRGIARRIFFIRGQKVILDADLARTYDVTTARLNEQVKRNLTKFPEDFVFQLSASEFALLMSQIATSNVGRGGRRKLPWAFTEHGAIMAATVLNSERAVAMSVYVVRAFVKFRKLLAGSKDLAKKFAKLEKKLTKRLDIHEKAILKLFAEIREILNPPPPTEGEKPKRQIGFHGD